MNANPDVQKVYDCDGDDAARGTTRLSRLINHRPTANPNTPTASTRARVDIKPTFLQLELAKFVHTAPKYAKNLLGLACFTGKGLNRGFTDPAKGL